MLALENVSQLIGQQCLLDGANLNVPDGTTAAIVGPNGAGKSVLLRTLALVDPPARGNVQIGSQRWSFPEDTQTVSPPWPDLTIVFQQLFLWPHLTVGENFDLVLQSRDPSTLKRLNGYLEFFGIGHLISRYPNQMSLGQRQITALVRALVLQPRYLLLDEVTAALDVQQATRVLEVLRSERKERELTILFITHLFGLVRQIADQVVFIDSGRVVETGPSSSIDAPKTQEFRRFVDLIEGTAH